MLTRIASVHSSRGARRLGIESLESRHLLVATPLITEFMADNTATLFNELAQGFPDWIEIYNPGPGSVDLQDWYLTPHRDPPPARAPGGGLRGVRRAHRGGRDRLPVSR